MNQIKTGAIISYAALGINILTGIFYTPWMIHSIGRDDFGLYTLAMSVISLFVFDFGLSSSVTRFIAKYLALGRQDLADRCLGLVYKLYIYLDIVLFVVLCGIYFFIPQIYEKLTPDEISKFKVIYIIAAIYSVISFPFIPVNGILTAHEKIIQLKSADVFQKLFIVISMTICLLMGYGLYALVMINAIAGILCIGYKLIVIRKITPQKVEWGYSNKSELKNIASYSSWVTVIALAQRCIFNLAPSILGIFSGATAIAILGIAITIEGYCFTFSSAINGIFLPKVSRIVVKEDGNVLPLMIKVGRLQLTVVALIVIAFIFY
ncbi:MAG: oligosaccharide flippase family protein, partial [Muribaculum sp.]|nr:oligosaccharide flippase family protein [Muribaculum sp.]